MERLALLSIAVPVFNEQAVLPELLRRLLLLTENPSHPPTEFVFVNDGSSDRTAEILEDAAAHDPRIVVIHLSRNFGHQASITAALDHVRGDAVVAMDADLQDAPEVIPRFLAKYAEGYDVVYAIRASRKEGPLLRLCYRAYYRLLGLLSDFPPPKDAGDFALVSRAVVEQLKCMREQNRYLRGLRHWVGFRQIGIPVDRGARNHGESKYSWLKLVKLGVDGIFSFSLLPLRVMTLFGGLTVAASGMYAVGAVLLRLIWGPSPQGFTTLIAAIVFLSGVQMVFLGVIGEYLGRVYEEVKGRPLYIVSSVVRGGKWTESTYKSTASPASVIGGGAPARSSSST